MNPKLEAELLRRWPWVFRSLIEASAADAMALHLDCGDGWFSLFDALGETLTAQAESHGGKPNVVFGARREWACCSVDINCVDDFELGAVRILEGLSIRICELTGAPGRVSIRSGSSMTLALPVAIRGGYVPTDPELERHVAPVPETLAFRLFQARNQGVLTGFTDLVPGWFDLIDVLVEQFVHFRDPDEEKHARIYHLQPEDGRLAVAVTDGGEAQAGAVACAIAMSARIDPITGVAFVPEIS